MMSETNSAGENARTDRDAPHDKKPDAHVLGRGETRVPDEDAVILTDGGRDLPRFVYDDEAISTGDIVVDLASGKALQVVGKSVQTVGEHPQTRSDDTAAMFGAHSAETVFDCVFLPDGEKVTPPTKTYAYPESRLLRYPVENATEYDGDIQTWLRTAFLDELANAAAENDRLTAAVSKAVREAYGEDLEATFRELIETKRDEPEVATDGGVAGEVQTGPEPRPYADAEPARLPEDFDIRAEGPATVQRKASANLVESESITVEIERTTRDPGDLAFFMEQADNVKWKKRAVRRILDAESGPSVAYHVDDYDEWSVTFDGDVTAWYAVVRQMRDGEFSVPDDEFRQSHVIDVAGNIQRENTRDDAAYWVSRLVRPLTDTFDSQTLYGDGPVLAYLTATHSLDGDIGDELNRLDGVTEGDR
jgi:hypothetical protein